MNQYNSVAMKQLSNTANRTMNQSNSHQPKGFGKFHHFADIADF